MMASNSKSKFELWDGLRTTLTIPSGDNLFLTTHGDGCFILPLCEEFLYDPFYEYIGVEIILDEDGDTINGIMTPMNLDQADINFESNCITKDHIEEYIEMSVCRHFLQLTIPEKS